MGKGPGLFADIGKKAKDLLTKDYSQDQKFTITTQTDSGLIFTSTGLRKAGFHSSEIETKFQTQNITTEVKVDTNSKIFTTITADSVAPGVKTKLSLVVPDYSSGKLELQYRHAHAGICTNVGLNAVPVVEANGVLGTEGFAIGGEVAYDTSSGVLTKYSAGVGITKPDFSASLLLLEKGSVVKASYVHTVSPACNAVVGAEIAHRLANKENTFTVGGSYMTDRLTTVKARLNNHGKLGALLQYQMKPKSLVTFSGEVDTKALEKKAKVGVAVALSP